MIRKILLILAGIFVGGSNVFAATMTGVSVAGWTVLYITGLNDSTVPQINPYTVSVKGTASTCPAGGLMLDTATADDIKVFMNEYMVAKASSLKMTVNYDETNGCRIKSFFLAPN